MNRSWTLASWSRPARACPVVRDEPYVLTGVQRVLEASPSGRAFLQEHGPRVSPAATLAKYFAALHSARRCAVLHNVNRGMLAPATAQLPDRLADILELARYDVFALDGHWHTAAAHDVRHAGVKLAVGHSFLQPEPAPQVRRQLATAQGLHEHALTALKRVKPTGLRQEVPTGRRVLLV